MRVCHSPRFFAAYRGLLRRIAPRHPPWTLSRLTILSISIPIHYVKEQIAANGDGGMGIRTPDIQLAKLALYQLSYAPGQFRKTERSVAQPPTV